MTANKIYFKKTSVKSKTFIIFKNMTYSKYNIDDLIAFCY